MIDQGILISNASTDKTLKVVGEPFSDDYYGIGVTRDDPQAKAFVNEWLAKIEQDGSWAKLWKATIGTVVAGEAPAPPEDRLGRGLVAQARRQLMIDVLRDNLGALGQGCPDHAGASRRWPSSARCSSAPWSRSSGSARSRRCASSARSTWSCSATCRC